MRLTTALAAKRVRELTKQLSFVELTAEDVATALEGVDVAGGRTHDLLHAAAAGKAGAEGIYTFNDSDFSGLTRIPIKHPPV